MEEKQDIIMQIQDEEVIISVPLEIFFQSDKELKEMSWALFKNVKRILHKEKVN